MLEEISHKMLLHLNPETAHKIGKWAMKNGVFAPGPYLTSRSITEIFGVRLDNPLGLAAGFDKNGELVDSVRNYGFGFIEVGSVTYHGGKGNKKPRLFRLDYGSLLNRMGLNGDRAEVVIERLKKSKASFGLNIAKTHNPEIIGDRAIDDILSTYGLVLRDLYLNDNLMYTVFNISCPNTKEGKTFEDPGALEELLSAVESKEKIGPIGVKFSPNLSEREIRQLVEICEEHNLDFYEAVNTLPYTHWKYGKGGLSGREVREKAIATVERIRDITNKPIIGVGGISKGEDMIGMKMAGANLFLAYNGFVYPHRNNPNAGPKFAHELNEYFNKTDLLDF